MSDDINHSMVAKKCVQSPSRSSCLSLCGSVVHFARDFVEIPDYDFVVFLFRVQEVFGYFPDFFFSFFFEALVYAHYS